MYKSITLVGILFFSLSLVPGKSVNAQSARDLVKVSESNFAAQQFDNAVISSISALMIEPSWERGIEALQQALPASIRSNENKITQLKESSAKFTGDYTVEESQEIVVRYSNLIAISDKLMNLPVIKLKKGGPIKFDIKNYGADLRQAKEELLKNQELAAEKHYQVGQDLLKQNNLEKSKLAAKEFGKALKFMPDYKDASSMYDQARKLAIKRIAIIPFENKSGKGQYGAVNETITDEIISSILNNQAAVEFVEIITRDQLQQVMNEQNLGSSGILNESTAMQVGKILGVSEIIVGQITQIASAEPIVTSKQYKNERQIYAKEGNYVISAMIQEYKKEASAAMSGSYKIIDIKTAKIIKTDSFKEDYKFLSVWSTYLGNPDAIGYNVPRGPEENAPIDEERVNIVARKLSSSLADKIIEYVR
jgi:tetratricopeptide (TPR) repeat protein